MARSSEAIVGVGEGRGGEKLGPTGGRQTGPNPSQGSKRSSRASSRERLGGDYCQLGRLHYWCADSKRRGLFFDSEDEFDRDFARWYAGRHPPLAPTRGLATPGDMACFFSSKLQNEPVATQRQIEVCSALGYLNVIVGTLDDTARVPCVGVPWQEPEHFRGWGFFDGKVLDMVVQNRKGRYGDATLFERRLHDRRMSDSYGDELDDHIAGTFVAWDPLYLYVRAVETTVADTRDTPQVLVRLATLGLVLRDGVVEYIEDVLPYYDLHEAIAYLTLLRMYSPTDKVTLRLAVVPDVSVLRCANLAKLQVTPAAARFMGVLASTTRVLAARELPFMYADDPELFRTRESREVRFSAWERRTAFQELPFVNVGSEVHVTESQAGRARLAFACFLDWVATETRGILGRIEEGAFMGLGESRFYANLRLVALLSSVSRCAYKSLHTRCNHVRVSAREFDPGGYLHQVVVTLEALYSWYDWAVTNPDYAKELTVLYLPFFLGSTRELEIEEQAAVMVQRRWEARREVAHAHRFFAMGSVSVLMAIVRVLTRVSFVVDRMFFRVLPYDELYTNPVDICELFQGAVYAAAVWDGAIQCREFFRVLSAEAVWGSTPQVCLAAVYESSQWPHFIPFDALEQTSVVRASRSTYEFGCAQLGVEPRRVTSPLKELVCSSSGRQYVRSIDDQGNSKFHPVPFTQGLYENG